MIDAELLEILRCPKHPDGPMLVQKQDLLICQVDGDAYRVVDGIPHMLPEDAIPAAEVEALLAQTGKEGSHE